MNRYVKEWNVTSLVAIRTPSRPTLHSGGGEKEERRGEEERSEGRKKDGSGREKGMRKGKGEEGRRVGTREGEERRKKGDMRSEDEKEGRLNRQSWHSSHSIINISSAYYLP